MLTYVRDLFLQRHQSLPPSLLHLLLNCLNTLPLALQVLLPQANLIIASRHRQDVAAQTPADSPYNSVELDLLAAPLSRPARIGGPDSDSLILRRRSDIALLQHAWAPRYVSDPVTVALQWCPLLLVALARWVVCPDLDQVIGSTSYKTALDIWAWNCGDQRSWRSSWCPGHRVDAHTVCREDLLVHSVIRELEHGDGAIGGGASEQAASFVWCPGEGVDRGGVKRKVVDTLPARGRSLFVDVNVAGVGGGGEDGAVLWVGPGEGPDGAFVARGELLAWQFGKVTSI